jgi:hypothetical protein
MEDLNVCHFINCRSSIPKLNGFLTGRESIYHLDNLAEHLHSLCDEGELHKFKAVLEVADCITLDDFLAVAENIDSYDFDPDMNNEFDYGQAEFFAECSLDENNPAMKHFDFVSFGLERMTEKDAAFTTYGLVWKRDAGQEMVQDENTGMVIS